MYFIDPSDCAEYPLCYIPEDNDYDHEWELIEDDPDVGITGCYVCVYCDATKELESYYDDY